MATPDSFIVDNTNDDWKALEYLRAWAELSESIDIATGHFEIGAFLSLDGEWQKVDKIRLLIGGETSRKTADTIAAALDTSIKLERQTGDTFLTGADAVVNGIRSGKVEIRVYKPRKFHAKAYITHARNPVVGSAALVGSSNFTRPGLTQAKTKGLPAPPLSPSDRYSSGAQSPRTADRCSPHPTSGR